MLKISLFNAGSVVSIPDWEAKIPHALQPKSQTVKQKPYCNKFIKGFKNGPHKKIFKKIISDVWTCMDNVNAFPKPRCLV